MITINKGIMLPSTNSMVSTIRKAASKSKQINPNQLVTTSIKGRSFHVSLEGWTQNDIDKFNEFNNKLGGIYTQKVLEGRLNPYLTEEQKKLSETETDNYFMETFMKVMIQHMNPENAYQLGQMIRKDINLGLKMGAEKYLATGACKLYISNAAELEKIKVKLIREETAIDEIKEKLSNLKKQYSSEQDPVKKKKIAKEHNDLANIHDTHVQIYNQLLMDDYTFIARVQRKLAKDITNKLLQGSKDAFYGLLGYIPKLPRGVYD